MSLHSLLHLTHGQVQILKIVLESGSLARAATILGLQPSTLSKSFRRLEDGFGVPLLKRHGKGVGPTRAGAVLLEHAVLLENQHKILTELVQAAHENDEVFDFDGDNHAPVVVAITREISDLLIGLAFARMTNLDDMSVRIHVDAGSRIEEQVANGKADIGLLCDTPTRPDLCTVRLAEEAMVLVFGPHLLNASDAITPRLHAMANLPMVLPTWEHSSRRRVEQDAMRAGVKLTVVAEIGDFSALKSLLRQGLGYAILPNCTVQEETARGHLCSVPMQGIGSHIGISMICRSAAEQQAGIAAARRELLSSLVQAVHARKSTSMRLLPQPG